MIKKIEIQNLKIKTFGFNQRDILDIPYYCQTDMSEFLIAGGKGAGKTTFLYVIAGLFLKLNGKVKWNGQNIYQMSPKGRDDWHGKNIGFIYQSHQINDDISVLDNILQPTGFDCQICPEYLIQKAEKLADKFGISIFRPVHKMTKIQKQYVAIARALILDADIIIADDLTAGLDAKGAAILLNHLRDECAQDSKLLILASDEGVVNEQIAPSLLLNHGRIADFETPLNPQSKLA